MRVGRTGVCGVEQTPVQLSSPHESALSIVVITISGTMPSGASQGSGAAFLSKFPPKRQMGQLI